MSLTLPPVADYEALIWDFDGTLVDLALDWNGLKDRIASLSSAVESRILRDMLRQAEAAGRGVPAWALVAEMEKEALDRRSGWIGATIELLRLEAARSVIVTNNVSATIERFFELAHLPAIPYVARDQVDEPKPDPEGALSVAEHWRGRSCLLIGDSDVDAALAHGLGIDFFRVEKSVEA